MNRPLDLAVRIGLAALLLSGCGDRCEQLCVAASQRLRTCMNAEEGLNWRDLGARKQSDFTNQCRESWERVSSDLTATEVREALAVCRDTQRDLEDMQCSEIIAIYAPQ